MKLKILIIEDEPLIRNELKALLQSNFALKFVLSLMCQLFL